MAGAEEKEKTVWREHARRQHRQLALFTVIHCWLRGLDGVVFHRESLLRLLGFRSRIKRERIKWLTEDLAPFFPHIQPVWWADKTNLEGELHSLSSLWISRREFPTHIWSPATVLNDKVRLARLLPQGPRIETFEMWPHLTDAERFLGVGGNYDEKLLATYLTLLCHGLISPKEIVHVTEEKDKSEREAELDDDNVLREDARRKHGPLALFTVIYCWQHGLDGIVLEKDTLLRLLGLQKVIRRTRVAWLYQDLKHFFPHQKDYTYSTNDSFACLVVCRCDLPPAFLARGVAIDQRVVDAQASGFRIDKLKLPNTLLAIRHAIAGSVTQDEWLLPSYLSLLCQGQISPIND